MAKRRFKEVWLTPSVLNWKAKTIALNVTDSTDWKRAYELWNHALKRLSVAATDDDRADVISILRRVLNHRLGRLKTLYLNGLPLTRKPAGSIEQLEFLGIARPTMVRKLLEIRNQIEYRDAKPPSKKRCAELSEFIWYFLRSTDAYVAQITDSFLLTKLDATGKKTPYSLILEIGPPNKWRFRIWWGCFEPDDLSMILKSGWLKINTNRVEKKATLPEITPKQQMKDTDVYIGSGTFVPDDQQIEKFCRYYFDVPKA
jgi:hypothetical protein